MIFSSEDGVCHKLISLCPSKSPGIKGSSPEHAHKVFWTVGRATVHSIHVTHIFIYDLYRSACLGFNSAILFFRNQKFSCSPAKFVHTTFM